MLIGFWQLFDNYYIFGHTLERSVLQYKPDPSDPAKQKDSPIVSDMTAWLTIDGTNIDYPVMQGGDNIKYLNTDPLGEYSLSGSIFLDFRSSPDFTDDFSIVYGHHMEYGKMFGALDDFLNASYLSEHTTGTLMVGRNAEKVYDIEVFASMRVGAREKIVFDMQQDAIRQYIENNSTVFTGAKDARILGLSTCADSDLLSRIVVFCYILE